MAYRQGTPSQANNATNNRNIDGLLHTRRWLSSQVSYSFTDNFTNDYEEEAGYRRAYGVGFEPLNRPQRAAVREIMEMYEAASGLNLSELMGVSARDATIRIARSADLQGEEEEGEIDTKGEAGRPGPAYSAGDVWIHNRDSFENPRPGNQAYQLLMHEIGHALGLKHPFETGGVANVAMAPERESREFSVMSYRPYVGGWAGVNPPLEESWGYSQSLMIYDIAAIQAMYGANFNTNAGDTTYTFSVTTGEMSANGVSQGKPGANRIYRTIWDGNGIDTYDFSNFRQRLNIDLRPGQWSDLSVGSNVLKAKLHDHPLVSKHARGHIFNALQYNGDPRSLIENAKGGPLADRITGNDADNRLYGNNGDDILYGRNGKDTLFGNQGNDKLYGGNDDDRLYGNEGNDTIYGENGNDRIDGGTYDDRIYGGNGNDIIWGYSGNDYLRGGNGEDDLRGESDNDTLTGDNGNDRLIGASGGDMLVGANPYSQTGSYEIDTLIGGADRDLFVLGVSGNTFGGASPRVLYDDGNSVTMGNFSYARISDFVIGEDRIQLRGSRNDYQLDAYQVNGASGTGIYYTKDQQFAELIGFVENIAPSELDLFSPVGSQFVWT